MSAGLEVRGVSGIVANIHAVNAGVQSNVRAAMQKSGREQWADTKAAAPCKTGFLAEHTRLDFSPEGLTYTVGYSEADFSAAGHAPYFYYVILGTSKQAPNPFIFNVHEAHSVKLTADVGSAVRAGLRSVR